MSLKQDRQGVRTASELERKYGFGKTFAEILGIAEGAQDAAEQAKSAVSDLDNELTQEEIFNRLTNNGAAKGVYRDEAGNIYINADYIKSGKISSDIIDGSTLNITDGARIANFYIKHSKLYNGIEPGNANSCGFGCGSALGGNDDWIFWAGNGAFRVTLGGYLYANNANISGTINASEGKIGSWDITDGALTTTNVNEDGGIVNSVYIEPERLVYIRNQDSGDGEITSWENVAKAGKRVGDGVSGSFTIDGSTYTFMNGVLTSVT